MDDERDSCLTNSLLTLSVGPAKAQQMIIFIFAIRLVFCRSASVPGCSRPPLVLSSRLPAFTIASSLSLISFPTLLVHCPSISIYPSACQTNLALLILYTTMQLSEDTS